MAIRGFRDLEGIRGMGKPPIMMNRPTGGLGSLLKRKVNTMPVDDRNKVKPTSKFGRFPQNTSVSVAKAPSANSYTDIPYDQRWWSRVKLQDNLSPEQMHQIYMEHGHPTQSATIGSFGGEAMPNPNFAPSGVDPVTAAVNTLGPSIPNSDPFSNVSNILGPNSMSDEDIRALFGGNSSQGLVDNNSTDGSMLGATAAGLEEMGITPSASGSGGMFGPFGTSGISTMDSPPVQIDPVTAAVDQATSIPPILLQQGPRFNDIRTIDDGIMGPGEKPNIPITNASPVIAGVEEIAVDPVTTAVDQMTGGEGVIDSPVAEQEPDFMTQLNELIAQMQAEQTTAAETQAAAQVAEQQRIHEMAQNYVVDGSAMGYNPYMSGQYQSNPYGNAGVPNMGGITSIPVPAPLQNFEQPQDQPSAMEMFNAGYAGYQSPRTITST